MHRGAKCQRRGDGHTRALERAKSAFISMNGAGVMRVDTDATAVRKSPPLNQISSRNMPRPERIKMISVQVTGLFRSAHMVVPSSLQRSPAAPSRPNGWDRHLHFLEYRSDAQNHSRITVLDVVARLLWRNSRFARAMVMAMR